MATQQFDTLDHFPQPAAIPIPAFATKSKESLTGLKEPATVATHPVTDTLNVRGTRYGKFSGHAVISQHLKDVMQVTTGWQKLNASQREALDMIAHKIARILNGDPNYADSWHDIAGYATLIDKQLNGENI